MKDTLTNDAPSRSLVQIKVQTWSKCSSGARVDRCGQMKPLHGTTSLHVDLLVFKIKVHTWSKCSSGARVDRCGQMKPLHGTTSLHVDLLVFKIKVHTWSKCS